MRHSFDFGAYSYRKNESIFPEYALEAKPSHRGSFVASQSGATAPQFDLAFEPRHGQPVVAAPGVIRVTAANPGPFTFHGTNTYLVGDRRLAVIDPGPDDETHLAALLSAIGRREVSHVLVTHTHADHSPLARRLARLTGATLAGEGPHRAARPLHIGEANPLDASADRDFAPDLALRHGDRIDGDGWSLEAVATPGHAANHLAFALQDAGILFSGDHVMAWSTSIVAPPDGAMADYMSSLETVLARPETTYLPGHGGVLDKAKEFVRALRTHRKMRETAILARIRAGDRRIPAIVKAIYRDTDPRLHGAAALSVLAHVEDLVAAGKVESSGPPSLEGEYAPPKSGR
jgi:glyoxylase-like metal-dependent hydrolase (beta-lactamase superfamily II)